MRRGQLAEGWVAVFPDWHIDLLDLVADKNKIALRLRWSGTQSAPVLDVPVTGRRVHVDEMLFLQVTYGLTVDGWRCGTKRPCDGSWPSNTSSARSRSVIRHTARRKPRLRPRAV